MVEPQDAIEETMFESVEPLDINTASLRKLVQIPGVGRVLARQIIDNRPYTNLDDLSKLPGISKTKLDRINTSIYIAAPLPDDSQKSEPQQEVTALPPSAESILPEPEPLPEPQPLPAPLPAPPSPPRPEQKPQPPSLQLPIPHRYVTYQQTFMISAVVGAIVFLLSVIAVLGILAIINNGLHFVLPAELSVLSRETGDLRTKSEALSGDLDGLRQRLDNLEGLSGRMTALESADQEINTRLDAASTSLKDALRKVDAMSKKVDEISVKVDGMQSLSTRFRLFLDGLKDLLVNSNGK